MRSRLIYIQQQRSKKIKFYALQKNLYLSSSTRSYIIQKSSTCQQTQENSLCISEHEDQAFPKKRWLLIRNDINGCYFNAALQCLLNIKELALHYQSNHSLSGINAAFRDLIMKTWVFKQAGDEHYQINAAQLYAKFKQEFQYYEVNKWQQMDASEFLLTFIRYLYDNPISEEDKLQVEKGKALVVKSKMISQLFEGCFYTEIKCIPCKLINTSIQEIFLNLPLQIKQINYPTQKYQMISSLNCFQSPEKLQGDNCWFCQNCQKNTQSVKQTVIRKAGDIIIITLQRFSNGQKFQGLIQYPIVMNHSPEENKSSKYKLIGVINHIGRIYAGHYSCDCLDEETESWKRSQGYSTPYNVEPGQVINNRSAYVLMYRKSKV